MPENSSQLRRPVFVDHTHLYIYFHSFFVNRNVNKFHSKVMCGFVKSCMDAHWCNTVKGRAKEKLSYKYLRQTQLRTMSCPIKLVLHFRVFNTSFICQVSVRLTGHQYALSSS